MKLIFYLLITLFIISCNDSTAPTYKPNVVFKQIPGCNNSNLLKTSLDSCFNYTFSNSLKIDLCVPANCCPDSDRFDYSYSLDHNTINLTVLDTAAHLCRCICNYVVEIEISGLSDNRYNFYCTYDDSVYYKEELINNYFE